MPDRLAADLRRFFGVRLSDVWVGKEDMLEVAHCAANLPRGSAVSEWYGGWGAISAEDEALRRVEYLLQAQMAQAAGKKQRVPEPETPKGIRDVQARAKKKQDRMARLRQDAARYKK